MIINLHTFMLALLGLIGIAQAARNYTLYIKAGTVTFNGTSGAKIPGSSLITNEVDTINITVLNKHALSHNLLIHGVTSDVAALSRSIGRTGQRKAGWIFISDITAAIPIRGNHE